MISGTRSSTTAEAAPIAIDTGYGRKGIFELLRISEPIRNLINERAPAVVLRQKPSNWEW
jgi:type IV pilus assembly protein PilB